MGPFVLLLLGAAFLLGIVRTALRWRARRRQDRWEQHLLDESMAEDGIRVGADGTFVDDPVPENDSWEGAFWDVDRAYVLQKFFRLEYVDARGTRTTRDVEMRAFDPGSDLMLAHCHLRNATRTFRFSRIQQCVDLETGEIIPDTLAHCSDAYSKSPRGAVDAALEENFDAMMIMFFIGKADGRLTRKECDVIARFCAALTRNVAVTGEAVQQMFKGMSAPSLVSFQRAVGRLVPHPLIEKAKIYLCCKMILETENKISAAEAEALEYLRKRLLPSYQ